MIIEIRLGWLYAYIGLWTYVALMGARWPKTFRGFTCLGLLVGFLFCVTLWPLAPLVCYFVDRINKEH